MSGKRFSLQSRASFLQPREADTDGRRDAGRQAQIQSAKGRKTDRAKDARRREQHRSMKEPVYGETTTEVKRRREREQGLAWTLDLDSRSE